MFFVFFCWGGAIVSIVVSFLGYLVGLGDPKQQTGLNQNNELPMEKTLGRVPGLSRVQGLGFGDQGIVPCS